MRFLQPLLSLLRAAQRSAAARDDESRAIGRPRGRRFGSAARCETSDQQGDDGSGRVSRW